MIATLIILIYVILSVALITLAERKVMAALQRRIGPNQVGYLGLLQPFADGFKLILKNTIIPNEANHFIFLFAPYLFFFLALLNWLIIPFNHNLYLSEIENLNILFVITVGEFSIFGVIFSGWSANSKYPFVGSLRSTAQMISYSINLTILIYILILINGSADINTFFINQQSSTLNFFILLPCFILFIICAVAESNRAPFDLPEAESELVAGFMTEHGAVSFAFFFLAEYTNMLTLSTLFSIFFLNTFFNLPLLFIMLWLRASLPRFRFDQLLNLGWKTILPIALSFTLIFPALLLLI